MLDPDGTLKAYVRQTVRGDQEILVRLGFRASAQAQWKDLAQRISYGEGFGGEVSNVIASSPEDTYKPFEVSYDYTRKNYSDWDNHRMIAPLPVMGLEGAAVQEKKPADPVVLGGVGEIVYTANIKLPVDVEKLQSDLSLKEPYAEFDSTYSHVGDVLMVKRRLKIKQNEVPLAAWDNYKKFSKALSDDWGGYTNLYAGGADKNPESKAADTGTSKDNPPQDLLNKWDEADAAQRRNDLTTAEEILRDLLKKYGDGRGLHAGLGDIYARRNDSASALAEFEKEEQIHPDNVAVYQRVASYYVWLHRDDSAVEQYRKWIQVDSKNHDAYAGLSAILYRQKKYPELLALWQEAAKQLPDSMPTKRSLGYAYLSNHQPDKGVSLIEQSLASETKPMAFDSASYELAEANVELPKAKAWGDKAISGLYEVSLSPTIEESAALTNTANMAATWDTVGWVYYRMGDYSKAEAYLRSAFALSQVPVEGDHLAQVYEKQGKKQAAAHTYRLAYAATNYGSLAPTISDHYFKLMGDHIGKLTTTRKPDGTWTPSPAEELSRSRTTKISKEASINDAATFSIVFSPGRIEDVKFISGQERLKSMGTQIANSKLRADFPDSTPARLTRPGILVCGSSGCDFTLLLPDTPYATENVEAPN